jgi:hypothetical protein
VISGGLRARYLHDSLIYLVRTGLAEQGWFDPGRSHTPIKFLHQPVPWDEPVELNTLMLGPRNREGRYVEVGTTLTTDTIVVSVDFYAAGDTIGLHVTNDIRDILRGRIGTVSHLGSFSLYDFNQPTPTVIGHAVTVEATASRLPVRLGQEYTRHWHVVDVVIEDTYYDSQDVP